MSKYLCSLFSNVGFFLGFVIFFDTFACKIKRNLLKTSELRVILRNGIKTQYLYR